MWFLFVWILLSVPSIEQAHILTHSQTSNNVKKTHKTLLHGDISNEVTEPLNHHEYESVLEHITKTNNYEKDDIQSEEELHTALGINDNKSRRRPRNRRLAKYDKHWPKHKDGNVYVPYDITEGLEGVIDEAITLFDNNTCIRFVPRTDEEDYVSFISNDHGCWAEIGKIGGQQFLSLKIPDCIYLGSAIHEMMHVIGFYHTMNRRDRDKYIDIRYENMEGKMEDQFMKNDFGDGVVSGILFDMKSIMMYGSYAFSKNGEKTIISKEDPDDVYTPDTWSAYDILEINRLYNCNDYL